MDMKVTACFVLVILLVAPLYGTAARRNLEAKRHLSRLNKPSLNSIKSPDGDVIDCVHISQQPAFDHPLLRNHTIQMRPSYYPEGVLSESEKKGAEAITQLWQMNGRCPEGTIPIRKTRKQDLVRARRRSSIKEYGKKDIKSIPRPTSTAQNEHQHAIAYVKGGEYYGAKATINVWNPIIQEMHEFSLSQLWILGGSFDSDLNSIEAGWQVSPDLYGDNNTRLFTYWTRDAYHSTGCYNLLCSGFVQVNNKIAVGASISPISTYGSSQYEISLVVWKNPKDGNWWLQFNNGYVIGYWPALLFSHLSKSASMIEWGGEVVNSESGGRHTTTQMGSGHFAEEGFGYASFVNNIQIVDSSNKFREPKGIEGFTEKSNCYNVHLGKNGKWGNYFYYGGPGRNPNCL